MASTYRSGSTLSTLQHGQPITAVSFDPVSDTLWAGTNTGLAVAVYSQRGIRGVSFPVGGGHAVQKLVAGDAHIRAAGLSGSGVGSWKKGGANEWFYRSVRKHRSLTSAFDHAEQPRSQCNDVLQYIAISSHRY